MSPLSSKDRARLDGATAGLDPPFAVVDLDAFDTNAGDLLRRAGGTPVRLASKSVRCRELIDMLFYQNPPLPYEEVARGLGLARGSIGFIRMRCLKQLRGQLKERGFR